MRGLLELLRSNSRLCSTISRSGGFDWESLPPASTVRQPVTRRLDFDGIHLHRWTVHLINIRTIHYHSMP